MTADWLLRELGEVVSIPGTDGSVAIVALHGAHVVSWKTPDGVERLFLSSLASAASGVSIRGGIPVCFPQFAGLGSLSKHGFARTSTWRHTGVGQFKLDVSPDAWPGWPHACELLLNVELGPSTLSITLTVENVGHDAFSFTGALHTYLRCEDVTNVHVTGLDGLDILSGGRVDGDIYFADGEADVDLWILAATGAATVEGLSDHPPGSKILCAQTGFPDVVVWNIGARKGADMADLGPDEWRNYVCVESAVVAVPVSLDPLQRWRGSQILAVL